MKYALICILTVFAVVPAFAEWSAGTAKTVITPEKPMWMAGYGGRNAPGDGTETDLFGKALYLDDGNGSSGIVISLDVVGIDREFSVDLCKTLQEKNHLVRFGIQQ